MIIYGLYKIMAWLTNTTGIFRPTCIPKLCQIGWPSTIFWSTLHSQGQLFVWSNLLFLILDRSEYSHYFIIICIQQMECSYIYPKSPKRKAAVRFISFLGREEGRNDIQTLHTIKCGSSSNSQPYGWINQFPSTSIPTAGGVLAVRIDPARWNEV